MTQLATTPDQLAAYMQAVRSGASTPAAIRAAAGITERVRINVQRHAQTRGLVTWAEGTGWTIPDAPQRTCPRCNTSGPVDTLFGWRMAAGKQRPQSYCRPCRAAKPPRKTP